ncbi:MAG: hypothetical protein ABI806_09525, partial [Candidatus Solibacter sp.]
MPRATSLGLLAIVLVCAAFAQAPARPVPIIPADEVASRKALAIAESAPRFAAILQFFTDYPSSRGVPMMIVRGYAAAGRVTSVKALELAQEIAKRVARASPMARSEAVNTIAAQLLLRNFASEAEPYARAATRELNEEDFVARARAGYQRKTVPFYVEEA